MFTGEMLRLLRQARQFKQSDMARKMSITQQRYSVLEKSGKLSPEKQKLALSVLKYSEDEARHILAVLVRL